MQEIDIKQLVELQQKKQVVYDELMKIESSISQLFKTKQSLTRKKKITRKQFKILCSYNK